MHEISPSQLAARCRNTQPDDSHEPFCFELFRRAIAEGSSLCWHYLHNQYYSLVRYWVSRRAPPDPDTIDDLTQNAFTAFRRSYTADKLARARKLGDVLAYLRSCAASAVAQARREADRKVLQAEWDEQVVDACVSTRSAEASALQQLAAQRLWAVIEACCNDERERLVARLIFRAGNCGDGVHQQNGSGGWTPDRAVNGLAFESASNRGRRKCRLVRHAALPERSGPTRRLVRYDLATEAWRVYTTAHGLPADTPLPQTPAPVYALAMGEDDIPKWLALRITLGYTV